MSRSANAKRLVPCMPPLLQEETIPLDEGNKGTRFGGTTCEELVASYLLSQSINVAEPKVDDGVDLLLEKEPYLWKRGQVKKVVYQMSLDYGIKKRTGKEVRRPRYDFFYHSGATAPHLKNGRRQRRPEEIDYYYHVLITCYRQLIWETPTNIIPLRENGEFIQCKNPNLDRNSWQRKKADIDFNKLLVYSRYDPIIFKTYPDFFLEEQTTLEPFFDDDEID